EGVRATDARHLLDADREGERIESSAFIVRGDCHPEEAEARHLRDGRLREFARSVHLGRDRADLLFREVADTLPDHLVFGIEFEVHRPTMTKREHTLRTSPRMPAANRGSSPGGPT